jgi:uncharacterized protein
MTLGQKGCYIFCTDSETREYFKTVAIRDEQVFAPITTPYQGLDLSIVRFEKANPYKTHVPIFDLKAAAGGFSDAQFAEEYQWVELPGYIKISEGMFVMQVVGESMNRRIPNGSWCLFKANPGGTRNGKVVLVQHREIEDPDHGGSYTVKVYHSEKTIDEDVAINTKIVLKPDSNAYGYSPIVIEDDNESLVVLGEFLVVL